MLGSTHMLVTSEQFSFRDTYTHIHVHLHTVYMYMYMYDIVHCAHTCICYSCNYYSTTVTVTVST